MNTTDIPKFQQFHLEGVKHMAPNDAYDLLLKNEAVLIDVRTPEETAYERIPMEPVLYHPMDKIADRLANITKKQNIILICAAGIRSTRVANLLALNGYHDVANLDGGLDKWIEMKLPFETNLKLYAGGCGCGSTTKSAPQSCCDDSSVVGSCC